MSDFSNLFDNTKPFSDTGAMVDLQAASTPLTWTVPGATNIRYRAEFAFNNDDYIWVAKNKTAVVPTAGAIVSTNQQELRPPARYVSGGDTLSFISTEANVQCGVTLLKVPNPA